jgi:hypothetical protein
MESVLIGAICLFGGGALFGVFKTKSPGFGKYTTSVVLLILVLAIGGLFLAAGRIESSTFANILFAVAGFAGGLITGKSE